VCLSPPPENNKNTNYNSQDNIYTPQKQIKLKNKNHSKTENIKIKYDIGVNVIVEMNDSFQSNPGSLIKMKTDNLHVHNHRRENFINLNREDPKLDINTDSNNAHGKVFVVNGDKDFKNELITKDKEKGEATLRPINYEMNKNKKNNEANDEINNRRINKNLWRHCINNYYNLYKRYFLLFKLKVLL